MARFVEFTKAGSGMPVLINADRIDGIQPDTTDTKLTMISCSGPDNVWWVTETVAEVLAKLQGDPQPEPAKAGDDITGWWLENVTGAAIYVIGQDYYGSWVYEMEESLLLRSHPDVIKQHYFRDPNRKGWDR